MRRSRTAPLRCVRPALQSTLPALGARASLACRGDSQPLSGVPMRQKAAISSLGGEGLPFIRRAANTNNNSNTWGQIRDVRHVTCTTLRCGWPPPSARPLPCQGTLLLPTLQRASARPPSASPHLQYLPPTWRYYSATLLSERLHSVSVECRICKSQQPPPLSSFKDDERLSSLEFPRPGLKHKTCYEAYLCPGGGRILNHGLQEMGSDNDWLALLPTPHHDFLLY